MAVHDGCMRVLGRRSPAPRYVTFDVTGILRHAIEGRRQHQHDLGVAAHEIGAHRPPSLAQRAVGPPPARARPMIASASRFGIPRSAPTRAESRRQKYARRYQLPSQASSSMPVSHRAFASVVLRTIGVLALVAQHRPLLQYRPPGTIRATRSRRVPRGRRDSCHRSNRPNP